MAKLKYFIALIAVMTMIYIQHDFVIYAESDELRKAEESGEMPSDEGVASPEEGADTAEEGDGKIPDEDGKEPGEGEEKNPEEGEDKPGGEEEKPPVEDEKKIDIYEVKIPKADGKEGYYISKPEIAIKHVSEWGVTKYCLVQEDKKTEEKVLTEKGERAIIESRVFSEGKNILHIWMEDEEGKRIEEFDLKKELLIDTKAPEIHMSVPRGFESWYQEQVMLSVSGEDSGSGVEKLSCKAGDKVVGTTDKIRCSFMITQASEQGRGVEVTVTAQDKAGNKSERVKNVYIDGKAPEILISGIKNYMITGKDADISCEVNEENILQEYYAQITWENVRGKRKLLSADDWKADGTKRVLTQKLKNDGTYYIKVHVKDMSGHVESKEMQIIIDKTDPVIRYIESLKGRFLKSFEWNCPPQKMIWDFTTYTYEVRLDGRLYHMGDVIEQEGTHRMTVKVTDAAGNKAESAAEFVIDHTAPKIIFFNIEEGEEYEEERTFKVEVERTEDTIRQIQINGKNQKIASGNRTYEYSLDTCQDYEITVKASDRAGNETEKTIYFQIVPRKTFVQTLTSKITPHKDMNDIQKSEKTLQQSKEQRDKGAGLLKAAGIGTFGILATLGAVVIFINRKLEAAFRDEKEDRGSE